mmetsp:Transcript_25796/g.76255  ORF Transcript_25796/g.76255 Transcript_25796/m.76255 type:complete len:335 (+) Transcript_25796:790-1794(+)
MPMRDIPATAGVISDRSQTSTSTSSPPPRGSSASAASLLPPAPAFAAASAAASASASATRAACSARMFATTACTTSAGGIGTSGRVLRSWTSAPTAAAFAGSTGEEERVISAPTAVRAGPGNSDWSVGAAGPRMASALLLNRFASPTAARWSSGGSSESRAMLTSGSSAPAPRSALPISGSPARVAIAPTGGCAEDGCPEGGWERGVAASGGGGSSAPDAASCAFGSSEPQKPTKIFASVEPGSANFAATSSAVVRLDMASRAARCTSSFSQARLIVRVRQPPQVRMRCCSSGCVARLQRARHASNCCSSCSAPSTSRSSGFTIDSGPEPGRRG